MKACYIEGICSDGYQPSLEAEIMHQNLFTILDWMVSRGVDTFFLKINSGITYRAAVHLAKRMQKSSAEMKLFCLARPDQREPLEGLLISPIIKKHLMPCIVAEDEVYEATALMLLVDSPEPDDPRGAEVINLSQRELYLFDDIARNMILDRIDTACGRTILDAVNRVVERLGFS